ncbi:MAG: membrane protein insertase YidC, partial [Cyclobacteriaceae bacterium]
MDRNQITGLIMMLVLLTVYFQFFAPEPPQPDPNSVFADSIVSNTNTESLLADIEPEALPDSIQDVALRGQFGEFATAASGKSREITIENDQFILTFDTKGATVKKVQLKEHLTSDGDQVVLFNGTSSDISLLFNSNYNVISTGDLYFNTRASNRKLSGEETTELVFSAKAANGGTLDFIYTAYGSGYQLGFEVKSKNIDALIDNTDFNFLWSSQVRKLEMDLTDARNRTTIKYFSVIDDDVDYLTETSTELEELNLEEQLKWVSIKQKFFTSAIIADQPFSSGFIQTDIPRSDEVVKNADMRLVVPVGDIKTGKANFTYYFGPNDYNILDNVTDGFWKNLTLGWGPFGLVNKYLVIPIFSFLDTYLNNYGLIILLLVIAVRLILAPLTFTSHMSMAKMKVLKPELDEIKERHDGDAQKAQAEQMQLYQKVGINPLSGCFPLLLQMPILLAMFYFFPNAIELRQQSFLWATDLSTYDSILTLPFTIPFYGDHVSLFTLLMTASTILYTWSNSQIQTVQGPMKSVQYVMPIMFLFFLNNYASGLTYYYFLTNLVSFGQIAIFRKLVDEEKILKKLEENKKKNHGKKTSGFQARLQEAMKASQEQQRKKKP